MRIRPFLFVAFLSLLPVARAADPAVLYDGAGRLPQGWRLGGWKGLTATVDRSAPSPEREASWRIESTSADKVEALAGIKFVTSSTRVVTLDSNLWNTGFLNIQMKWDGDAGAPIPLQAALGVMLEDGSTVETKHVAVSPYLRGQSGDGTGWFWIAIPLIDMPLPKGSGKASGICGLYLQTTANHPVLSTFHVGRVEIGDPAVASAQEVEKEEPMATLSRFRELSGLKAPFLLLPDARFDVDRSGNFTYEGHPRFIIGAQMPFRMHLLTLPTSGYPKELKWLYDEPLNYANSQRIGLDSVGVYLPPTWQTAWDVEPAMRMRLLEPGGSAATAEKILQELKLPIYVDFSLIPTFNGVLSRSTKVAAEAKNQFTVDNHFTPYGMLAPEGKELYMAMYKAGAEMMQRNGATPLYYELLNEPAYNDPSPYNRAAFASAMKEKYGEIAALNDAWGAHYDSFDEVSGFQSRTNSPALSVEWGKFMERAVIGLCREGISVISAVDKSNPRFSVQSLGGDAYRVIPKNNVNIYELSKLTQVITLPTGGGLEGEGAGGLDEPPSHSLETPWVSPRFEGMVMRRFYLSLAEGKPLVDGEHYFTRHNASDGFWLQLARGTNAAYIFAWDKRAWDWKPDAGPSAGRKLAQRFSFLALNPYAQSPDSLADIADAKEEILSLDDIFVPRQNRPDPEIALLLSYPTVRYSQAVGTLEHNQIRNYGVALDFAHYHYAVIPEEQIPEGKLDRYKALILPGISNVYEGTSSAIGRWVEAGGTLILGLEAMQNGELGKPNRESGWLGLKLGDAAAFPNDVVKGEFPRHPLVPGEILARSHRPILEMQGWSLLASLGGRPAILERRLGKGHIYYINAKMADYALLGLLGGLLRKAGLAPEAELARMDNGELEVNVELHRFSAGALTGFLLYNWDSYPKVFTFKSSVLPPSGLMVDPLRKVAFPINEGTTALWLPPRSKRVLVTGDASALNQRFDSVPEQTREVVEASAAVSRIAYSKMAAKEGAKDDFEIRGDKINTLDLRPFANRDFHDSVPGDGKGGWTDQGENSLEGVEWGRQAYRGVPFEIIRPDMNGDKGAIVLASKNMPYLPEKLEGIPVGDGGAEKVRKLFFLHATAWSERGKLAFTYLLHHPDGSTTSIPIRVGHEVGDWWIGKAGSKLIDLGSDTRVAWTNLQGCGFWAYEWVNPNPEKPVTSIDIVSAKGHPAPLIVAITAELQ